MTREVDLISYLPPFLVEFKEIAVTLKAENPEFMLVCNAIERVLQNEFIETADEYGILRFEKIMKIFSSKDDTIENRRFRIQSRWFDEIPYTIKMLVKRLTFICGKDEFFLFIKYNKYLIYIKLPDIDNIALCEAKEMFDKMIPANMNVNIIFKNIHEFFKTLKHFELKKFSHFELQNKSVKKGFLNV